MAFYSILADWDERNNLNILYKAIYYDSLQEQGFPESRFGYEELHIDKHGLTTGQKPRKIIGKFWHCLSRDGKPVFMGDVVYERRSK